MVSLFFGKFSELTVDVFLFRRAALYTNIESGGTVAYAQQTFPAPVTLTYGNASRQPVQKSFSFEPSQHRNQHSVACTA